MTVPGTMPVLTALAVALLVAPATVAAQAAFHVATDGSDDNPGTEAEPFATLERARDAVREIKQAGPLPEGGVTVFVRGGQYEIRETLALGPEDSGTAEAPVTYRAYEGERPVLVGGRAITGWEVHEGEVLRADVGAQGFEGIHFRQLLCNGERQHLARYPDHDAADPVAGGWAYADGTPIPMYQSIPDEPRNVFQYREEDARDWARPEEAEVMVFPRYNWWNNIIRIASLDRETRTITLAGDASYPIRPGDRYWVQNVREELDAPGEWYLDRETWTLYFWPPEGADPATMNVVAPVVRTIVQMAEGTAHIIFRGFVFECAEGTAIVLNGTSNCLIAGCTIRNVGDYDGSGVSINGGWRNGVAGCDIHHVGRNGVNLSGGDNETLEPGGNYADNNYMHHTGVYYKQGVGVSVTGVGNRASHNLIHDCPRFGIVWGGNDHALEFNHIRHVNLETADCGAIYSWQVHWARRGTVIRYNYLHDIIGFGRPAGQWTSPHYTWGIYLDDGTCGTHVYGNIVVRTVVGGVHIHGGRDNIIENNILVEGRDHQMVFSGYLAGRHPVPMMTERWNEFSGTPAYAKYPGWAELTESLEHAWQMAGNKFRRNIIYYNQPGANLYRHSNLPYDKSEIDHNLIWSHGEPLRTGISGIREVTGPNLAPNPGFEEGEAEAMPPGWHWQIRPGDTSAAPDTDNPRSGARSVRLEGDGTTTDTSGQVLPPNFVSADLPITPGATYRMRAWVRADDPETRFTLMAQAYRAGEFFWARTTSGAPGTEWKQYELIFRMPAPAEGEYRENMDQIRIRIDIQRGEGTIWLDDVELYEAVPLDEWEAWRELGLDVNSVVADPLFVDPEADDYRLRPDSPAFALGFEPIPVERIGPYEDDLRASWPIVEAPGAREHTTYDWSRR